MLKSMIFLCLVTVSLSQANCLTWIAPSELVKGYDERIDWELQAFDLLDLESQPCKHTIKIELKPIQSNWFVLYQIDDTKPLRKEYKSLDDFSNHLTKDLNTLLGSFKSKSLRKQSNRFRSNQWNLLKSPDWPLFEVSIVTESRVMDQDLQSLSGLEFAVTRPIGPWQTELLFGGTYNPESRIESQALIRWSSYLGLGINYDFWNASLHSPFVSSGLDLKGLWLQTPDLWKGSQFNLIPDFNLGVGWRGFKAHAINLAIKLEAKIPLGQIEFLEIESRKLKTYYPLGFGFKIQAGF